VTLRTAEAAAAATVHLVKTDRASRLRPADIWNGRGRIRLVQAAEKSLEYNTADDGGRTSSSRKFICIGAARFELAALDYFFLSAFRVLSR
jgi:hypothetical protein